MLKIKTVLIIILTLSLFCGGYLALTRHQIEEQNKTVELAADYSDLELLASRNQYPLKTLLSDLKNIGITSIGLKEETPFEASGRGEVQFGLISDDKTYFLISDQNVRRRILNHLLADLPSNRIHFEKEEVLQIDANLAECGNLGIGLSEKVIEGLSGFRIIPRISNQECASLTAKINQFQIYDTVIFEGEEIIGYPDKIKELAGALKANKINYGHVEIIKQFGNNDLKKIMGPQIVRVHGISADELKKVDREEALERFSRAAKERSIRMLYLRPYQNESVKANLEYFSMIKKNAEAAGFKIGRASQPEDLRAGRAAIVILGLGVAAGAILVLEFFFALNPFWVYPFLFLSAILILLKPDQGLLAFCAAVIFPVFGILSAFSKKYPDGNAYKTAALITVDVAVSSFMGAVLITGLLADSRYLLGALTFPGVKLSIILPVLIIAAYFFFKDDEKSIDNLQSVLNYSIPVSSLVFGGIGLLVLALILARSGNFILPVLDLEKYLRAGLEKIFFVRPRFKEFMIGYPAMYLAALLYLKNKKSVLWVFLAAAALAPISLVNSFTHIHTPLIVSFIRMINGLALGIIIGYLISRLLKDKL